jgi:signal transduction histidine kinase
MITAKSFLLRYIFALSLIFVFVTLTFTVSSFQKEKTIENANIINVAGRQRMLSQRISLFALNYFHEPDDEKLGALKSDLNLFIKSHHALVIGDDNSSISGLAGIVARDIYQEQGLDAQVKKFHKLIFDFVSATDKEAQAELLNIALNLSTQSLLKKLDEVVHRVEEFDTQENKNLSRLELSSYIIAVFILILEAILIFWPSYKRINLALEEKDSLDAANSLLEKANSELEEFAYRTSHDLRSPIVSSMALASIISRSLEDKDFQKAKKSSALISESLSKLDTLIRDIHDLTQTKYDTRILDDVDVKELVNESIDKFNSLEALDKINFFVLIDPSLKVRTDVNRLRLILESLISNAIKYKSGEVTAPQLTIKAQSKAGLLYLSFEDNGLGIPQEQHKNMFKMFKRFHPKISFGSGLGLYMVKKSCENLGGEISFESTPEGTKFHVNLPVNTLTP